VPVYRAHFSLDNDVSDLFPYINAVAENTKYFKNPHYIQFSIKGIDCALYPDKVIARLFENQKQALDFFVVLKDFLNDLESRKDSIVPDHKAHEYIPVIDILKLLPKTNCGECNFPTCMAFADAVSKSESIIDNCPKKKEEV
jgi:ArsR family metal-binding transcriptional regulator